ncbi:MAG: nitrate reductase cytochrome c-type subunit [Alphaproteobacteria bacterium]|nr:nitrate reductase cytochrome c-type subunit [Alphaproteobacteria bacterium]
MYKIFVRYSKLATLAALAVLSLTAIILLSAQISEKAMAQQTGGLQSLRGETEIPDQNTAPTLPRQDTQAGSFERAYRQQPPLIPHKIDGYQIDRSANQCMQCHDWPYNVDQQAPKISETHYISRDGVALDEVSPRRWFCTQCHTPQSNAKELVRNNFKSASDLD